MGCTAGIPSAGAGACTAGLPTDSGGELYRRRPRRQGRGRGLVPPTSPSAEAGHSAGILTGKRSRHWHQRFASSEAKRTYRAGSTLIARPYTAFGPTHPLIVPRLLPIRKTQISPGLNWIHRPSQKFRLAARSRWPLASHDYEWQAIAGPLPECSPAAA